MSPIVSPRNSADYYIRLLHTAAHDFIILHHSVILNELSCPKTALAFLLESNAPYGMARPYLPTIGWGRGPAQTQINFSLSHLWFPVCVVFWSHGVRGILGDIETYWANVEHVGKCWKLLEHIKNCWNTSEHF